jgi:hypothetical protein
VPDAENPKPPEPASTTPQQFPETTPPSYPGTDYSFTLQAVYDLKGAMSRLEHTVQQLDRSLSELKTDVRGVQRTLWLATGGVAIIVAVLGFFGNRFWDTMMQMRDYISRHP